jgi:tetratricopeptide (TPR) repeat protein
VLFAFGSWLGGRQLLGWHHWRAGRATMQRFDFSTALEHFECCLRVWPGSSSVQMEAARAARRLNRYDRFEELLAACEKHGSPEQTALERELALAQQGILKPDVEKALQDLADANHPEAVSILEALSRGYLTSFRTGFAMLALEKLIERAPDHAWAHYWRGNVLADEDHLSDAIPDFRRAVGLAPNATLFHVRLAVALVKEGNATDAWPHVAVVLRQEPANVDGLLAAAKCQRDFGDREKALEYLKQLLAEYPKYAEGWELCGLIASDEGDAAEAVRYLRKAFLLAPRSYSIGFSLFNELTGQGKQSEAKVVLNEIDDLKKQGERLKALREQLNEDGRNVAIRHELGTLFLKFGNEAMALQWFESVLQIDPAYRPTHAALADYHRRKGNKDAAIYHQRQAGAR